MTARVGFIGLGIMGQPMASRLAGAGVPLTVWNRSDAAAEALVAAGARRADNVAGVFAECETVLIMLRNEAVLDSVLRGGPGGLAGLVPDHTVVNIGTVSPAYSRNLAREIESAGGDFAEAPVSGSRRPAEEGALVAMIAGRPGVVEAVTPLLARLCAQVTPCGEVPAALTMKLASSAFLMAVVTGLAEAFHFGREHGVDLALLRQVLDAGQMSSPISRVKSAKLVDDDLAPQAAITDVLMNVELVVTAAREARVATPLLDTSRELYAEAVERGDGAADMIAVIRAIADRTAQQRTRPAQ
jgi:3-hydroxyisobutyrate dehydrogenase